jgi:hypothetical protein
VHSLIAAGADLDAADDAVKRLARCWLVVVGPSTLTKSKPRAERLQRRDSTLCDDRALEVCIGLQSLRIDALANVRNPAVCVWPVAQLIPFHIWWKIATTVKHFQTK